MKIKNVAKKSYHILKNLNAGVRPQDNFFSFACEGWIKRNPIPSTKSKWGTFYVLREDGLKKMREIVEEISRKKGLKKGSETQYIRDFYRSGIDTKTRNKLGVRPIRKFLERIENISSYKDLVRFIATQHRDGFSLLWGTHVWQDDKDSEHYNVFLVQDGLSLPDRDFYLKKDRQSIKIQKAFLIYIENIFVLLGTPRPIARQNAFIVFTLETRLARVSMNKVDMRDIEKIYNKKRISELQKLAPSVHWRQFLSGIGLKNTREVIVMQPKFLSKATTMLSGDTPLSVWKTYLQWSIANEFASFLSADFVREKFKFYGKVLTGKQKMEQEWKKVIDTLEGGIGDALGKKYVERYFPLEAKKRINDMVEHLFTVYRERIRNLDWMSARTKKKALKKLVHMSRKLGYPDKWKSYRGLLIKSDTYVENILQALRHERSRELSRFGKKVNKNEWFMTPQTVNAYYSPNMNEIVFPAGILQPPFFDLYGDDALNYGAIGSVIGHEMTHGFDDQGAKFDHRGNFNNWWTKEDKKCFEQKAKRLVSQFNAYAIGKMKMNGKLTLGENIADLGGLTIAYDAYQKHLKHTKRKTVKGFTPEQRFFLGAALVECSHERPESERTMVLIDPHSRPIFRVNGPASNMLEFYETYKVKRGDALYRNPRERAEIW